MGRVVHLPCGSCGAPLGEQWFEPLRAECSKCRATHLVQIDPDGKPTGIPEPYPEWQTLRTWIGVVRRVATSQIICLGACPSCRGPLVAPATSTLSLPCSSCGNRLQMAAATAIAQPIDGWEVGLGASAPGRESFNLRYSIERAEAGSLGADGCPQCGAPIPQGHQSDDCAYCGTRLWMVTPDGQRYTYVLAMKGTRDDKPVDQRVPLGQADQVIEKDAATLKTVSSCIIAILIGVAAILLLGAAFVAVVVLLNVLQ